MKKFLAKNNIWWFLFTLILLLLTYPLVRAQVSSEKPDVKKVEYTSQNLPDPFQSPFETEVFSVESGKVESAMLSHLQVQGMVWNSALPEAIINNSVVRVGEVIEGAKILDIRKEGIYVEYEKKQYILRPIIPKR